MTMTDENEQGWSVARVCRFLDIPGLLNDATLGVILGIVIYALPIHPLFIPSDDSLSDFPHIETETVPSLAAGILVVVINVAIIGSLFAISTRFPHFVRPFNPFSAFWTFGAAWLVVLIITEIFRNYVGRASPDVYTVCGYNANYERCNAVLGRDAKMEFRSWPSGHSSTSMFGGTFAGLFFRKAIVSDHLWIATLGSLFLFFGFAIGATRIRDFKSHTDDVIAGLFVGWVCTYMVWIKAQRRIFSHMVVLDESFHKTEV
jgi:phosphatidate phosphatase